MQTKTGSQVLGGVTEEDVKAVLKQSGPIKSHDLVNKFKSRLMTTEVSFKDKKGLNIVSSLYVINGYGVNIVGMHSVQCSMHVHGFF